jgi:hypothetical protein
VASLPGRAPRGAAVPALVTAAATLLAPALAGASRVELRNPDLIRT